MKDTPATLFYPRSVWVIGANKNARLVTNVIAFSLEGTITKPATAPGQANSSLPTISGAIETNGTVTPFDTTLIVPDGIAASDFDIVPPGQDLCCSDEEPDRADRASCSKYRPAR